MKILVTGFTGIQCGSTIRPIQKIDVPAMIVDELRAMGHEVEWRPPDPKETVEGRYDLLWVNVAPPTSLSSRYAPGALMLLRQDLPRVVFFDDWKTLNVKSSLAALARHKEVKLRKGGYKWFMYKGDADFITANRDAVAQQCLDMLSTPWWERVVAACPAFRWGDKSLVPPRLPGVPPVVKFIDPSPMIPLGFFPWSADAAAQKRREWTLASLSDQQYWVSRQKLSWPVVGFGVKKLKQPRLASEAHVQLEVAERWGTLAPRYPQVGSGWFRARFLYAANSHGVVLCAPGDAKQLGEPFLHRGPEYEAMDDGQLADLAYRQAGVTAGAIGRKKDFTADIQAVVHEARVLHAGGVARLYGIPV